MGLSDYPGLFKGDFCGLFFGEVVNAEESHHHTTTAPKRTVGSINNGIHVQIGNIISYDFNHFFSLRIFAKADSSPNYPDANISSRQAVAKFVLFAQYKNCKVFPAKE